MASTEQEHAEILAEVNRQLQEFGRVLPNTQASLDASSIEGVKSAKAFKVGLDAAGQAAVDVIKAYTAAAGAMYNGEKGMKAYNKSVDAGASAVGNLATAAGGLLVVMGALSGPVGLLVAGVGLAVKGIAEYTKATNEMSDNLFDSFQKLSRVGGAGADSLQGVYNDMQKLGLGVQDLDKFVALVAGSSKELAMMSGSVIKGRKDYAEMSKSMEQFKGSLMNSGMTQDEINEGAIGYLRIQSRIGMTQNKSANELAASTAKYLEQQDALTQLTGLTRKEQEATREEIRSQEAFGAKLLQLRNAGQEDAAKELEDTYLLLASKSKSAAQGFGDIATGNLRTEAAQKSMRATQGESMRTAQALAAGQLKAAEGADSIAQAHARTLDTFGETQGQLGNYNKTFSDFGGDMALKAGQASGGFAKQAAELDKNRKAMGTQGGKALSAEQQRQVDLAQTQQKSMQNMQDFVRLGVEPATAATAWFAETVETLTSLLPGAGAAKKKLEAERQGKKEAEKRNEDVKKAELEATAAKVKMDTATNDEAKKAAELELKAAEEKVKLAKEAKERGGLSKAATEAPSTPDSGGYDANGNPTGTPIPTPETPPPPPPPPPPAPAQMGGKFNRMPGATTTPGVAAAPAAAAPSGGGGAPAAAPAAAAPTAEPKQGPGSAEWWKAYTAARSNGMSVNDAKAAANKSLSAPPAAPVPAKPAAAPASGGTSEPAAAPASGGTSAPAAPPTPPGATSVTGPTPTSSTAQGQKTLLAGAPVQPKPIEKILDTRPGEITIEAPDGDKQKRMGTAAWRMNNPGNLRGKGTFLDKMPGYIGEGNAGPSGWFSVFKTKEDGAKAREELLFSGRSKIYLPESSIRSAMTSYAPPQENDTEAYIAQVAKAMGVPDSTKIKDLNGGQKAAWLDAITKHEGNREGKTVQAAEGGMFSGPKSGYPATLHGDEAVIPLKNGQVPVHIDSASEKSLMGGGWNELQGYNMGAITTDLAVLQKIAGKLGAYDKSTEMITDPKLWKEILQSGMMMNYDVGAARIGTKGMSEIVGSEAVADALAGRIKELIDTKKDSGEAIAQTRTEFADMMKTFYEDFFAKMQEEMRKENPLDSEMLSVLKDISKTNAAAAGTSEKMLRVAQN